MKYSRPIELAIRIKAAAAWLRQLNMGQKLISCALLLFWVIIEGGMLCSFAGSTLNEGWRNRTQEWLKLSEIHGVDFVAYGESTRWILDKTPDLYTTAWFVKIAKALGITISDEKRSQICTWLLTFRRPDGSFQVGPKDSMRLYDTFLAINILNDIGWNTPHAQGVMHFLAKLRHSDGLYYEDMPSSIKVNKLRNGLSTTFNVIRISKLLNCFPEGIEATRRRLLELLTNEDLFNIDSPDALASEGGLVLASLALLGVSLDDFVGIEKLRGWLAYWTKVLINEAEPLNGFKLNLLFRAVTLNKYFQINFIPPEQLKQHLFEIQLQDGGFPLANGNQFMEPQTTYYAIYLFNHWGWPYPKRVKLAQTLERYSVRNGWKNIVEITPRIDSTLSAVGIAKTLGFAIPKAKIASYLTQVLEQAVAEADPRNFISSIYYTSRIADLLSWEMPNLSEIKEQTCIAVSSLILEDSSDLRTLALGVAALKILGVNLSKLDRNRIICYLSKLQSAEGGFTNQLAQASIGATYYALMITKIMGLSEVNIQSAVRWISSFENPKGGYWRTRSVTISDMETTFLSLMALHLVGIQPKYPDCHRFFIKACRTYPFGFSFVPDSTTISSHSHITPTNLRVAYEALLILEMFKKDSDLSYMEYPP